MRARIYKISCLVAIVLVTTALLVGCGSNGATTVYVPYNPPTTQAPATTVYIPSTTVYVPPPTTVYIPPTTTTVPPPTTIKVTSTIPPQPTPTVWNWPTPGNTLNSQSYAYFPPNGARVQSGATLTLSWSADDNMDGYIFTSTQYNNFRNNPISFTYMARDSGPNGNVSVSIQNGDIYYAVVKNDTIFNHPIKLYQATLTAQ